MTSQMAQLLAREPVIGTGLAELLVKPDDEPEDGRTLAFLLQRRSRFEKVVLSAAASKLGRCWAVSGTPQYDQQGQFTGYVGSGVDITEQRLSARAATRLAMYDPLTGLANRLRSTEVLERILGRGELHRDSCAVLLIDLDRFKQVNDTLGHPAGDALLKQVANRLLTIVGDKEDVFRLGGDEFQIIRLGRSGRDEFRELAERVIATLSEPYLIEGRRCIIGASVGIAIAPHDGATGEDLLRNADLALYAAKGSGRGRAHFFAKDLLQSAEDKRALEDDLRDALARGEIQVFYQPVVNATTHCATAVEALVRWHHPERGAISPGLFIPIAEEINLIGPLGEWILRKACEDAASWPGPVRVAVNVSPLQFTSGALPSIVTSALAASGLSPDRLELEITEGVFLSDSDAADSVFAALKQIGVRLALDDFGTGYSSLGYLRTAPFDKIKIDQSFIRAATLPGSRNAAIIAAIVALAEALGMETTAEGIETQDQLELVRALRVSHVQGYIYSQALTSGELQDRLVTGEWKIPPSGPSKQRSERLSMYRKARAIFGNHIRAILIRNLSETGALVEGLDDVPFESHLIIDLGEGHLVLGTLLRSRNRQQGIIFQEALVSDSAGGFRTKRPLSSYLLQSSGMLRLPEAQSAVALDANNSRALLNLASKVGLNVPALGSSGAGAEVGGRHETKVEPIGQHSCSPTIAELTDRRCSVLSDSTEAAAAWRLLREYVVPTFGHMRPDALTPTVIGGWLKSKAEQDDLDATMVAQLQLALADLYGQALQSVSGSPSASGGLGHASTHIRDVHERPLSGTEIDRLKQAAQESANPQLKYFVSLLMLTRVRQRDLLEAKWDEFDLDTGVWTIHSGGGTIRRVSLSEAALSVLRELPRWGDCPFVLPNPSTGKPYRSLTVSWDSARRRANLADVEIDDLRYCTAHGDACVDAHRSRQIAAVHRFVARR